MKNEKFDYPIKYAVMPIEENIYYSWNEKEKGQRTVCYIVSKCYVINENKMVTENQEKTMYEIAFPYQKTEYNIFSRIYPNDFDDNTISLTNELFDTFEEAKILADEKNNEILSYKIGTVPFSKYYIETIKVIEKMHKNTLNQYKLIEQDIENMDLTENKTHDSYKKLELKY